MRKTSIDAYNEIREKGLLGPLQLAVYEIVFLKGPITQGEVWHDHLPSRQRPTVTPRFAELERLGVISSTGERPCRVTGKRARTWEATKNLPEKPPPEEKHLCLLCRGTGVLDR